MTTTELSPIEEAEAMGYPFMRIIPMNDILAGRSVDMEYFGIYNMPSLLAEKRKDPGYPALVQSIREWGLAYGWEPCWSSWGDTLGQGHHRVAALIELGAQWCPVKTSGDLYDDPDEWVDPNGVTHEYTH